MTPRPETSVALTFDFDGLSAWVHAEAPPGARSQGEFCAAAIPRILDLLAGYGADATFFVPGHTALTYPAAVSSIAEAGHEIGHHGWVHEPPSRLSPDEERRSLQRGIDALLDVAGCEPRGYRAPAWDPSEHTVELLEEFGLEYDSSLMGDDFTPYWCRVGDVAHRDAPFEFGRPSRVVELPVAWHMDDVPQFSFVLQPGGVLPGLHGPSAVRETWTREFDYVHDTVHAGLYLLTLHPQVIGRGYRMTVLHEVLDHIVGHDDVRFVTCLDYARAWRDGQGPESATAPRAGT